MKILVLTSTFPRHADDTEPRFVLDLCNYLAGENEIHVVAPHDTGIPTREKMGQLEVHRFRYCLERWQTLAYNGGILPNLRQNPIRLLLVPLFILSQLLLTARLLRRNDYDLIHAHWVIPQGFVAILARAAARGKPPIIVTSHGGDLFALKGPLLSWLKSWVSARAAHLTVVSSAMAARAEHLGIPGDKISVIPMGVDSADTFRPPPQDADREGLIFVGRLVDKKGIEYLIRAMPAVLAKHPDTRLHIIGDGPLREELEQLCLSLDVSSSVEFAGAVVNRDIPPHLQQASIAVIPSVVTESGDQEGAPVAIMETLACGCATIVSDYPGARDIIRDGLNGLLVDQRSPEQIAAALIRLLSNDQECRRLGEAGTRTIREHFDWRVISARFQEVFSRFAGDSEEVSAEMP